MNAPLTAIHLRPPILRAIAIAFATTAILSLLLWWQRGFDRWFLLAHNPMRDNPAIVALASSITRYGMSVICLLLLASIAASGRFPALRPVRPIILAVLLSFSTATLAGELLKELLARPRPIFDLAGQLNATGRHPSPSFPSGHASKSLALALPLLLLVPAGAAILRLVQLAAFLAAALVGYSRIVLGAHYLSDVIAGAALALTCVPVAVAAANAIYSRGSVTPEKLNSVTRRLMLVLLALTIFLPFF